MTDDELRDWVKQHPFISEYVEVMVTLSDGSYHGHLGFDFSCAGGGAASVRDLVDKFMQPARICYCCMLEAYRETDTNQAAWACAKKKCDLYCEACVQAEVECITDPTKPGVCDEHAHRAGKPFYEVRCGNCARQGLVCHSFVFKGVCMDCCGPQESYMSQVRSR